MPTRGVPSGRKPVGRWACRHPGARSAVRTGPGGRTGLSGSVGRPLPAPGQTRAAPPDAAATDDPAQAAEHLYTLTFGQVNSKSMLGTIELTEAVAERIITSGVRVFTRAYAPAEARSAASGLAS